MTERIAHALCPYCHPHDPTDPTDVYPPDLGPVTRWCGVVLPVGEEAPPDAERCPDCACPGSACAACGATATRLGVIRAGVIPRPEGARP